MVIARRLALAAPLIVAAIVIGNAWSGLQPGLAFWDTGEFQTVLPIMGTAHPTGYPTYVLLGFLGNILLTPIGEPAFRVTVLSLAAVAVAAAAAVVLVRRLTGSTIIGVATGLGLATTPVVWLNATRADPHPIHLAFVALLLLVLVWWEQGRGELRERDDAATGTEPGATAATEPGAATGPAAAPTPSERRGVDLRLILAAILFGLAAGNHSLTLLLIPPIGLYVLAVEPAIWRRPRFVLTCIAAVVATVVLVFLELPIRGGLLPAPLVYGRPATWDGFWYIALAEQFRGSLGDPFADLPAKLNHLVTLVNAQFGLLALAIPPACIVAAKRAPRFTLLTGLALVITVLFNQAYANADIERYYLGPVLWVWLWIGILAAELADAATLGVAALANRRSRGAPAPRARNGFRTASVLAATLVGVIVLVPTLAGLGVRRHAADRSGDTGAQAWLNEALPAVAQGAVLVSWWSTSTPLWYAQKVEGLRPDIDIIDDRTMLDLDLGRAPDVINRYLGTRPVYVIRLAGGDTDELTRQFDMTVVASGGNTAVWKVNGRLAAAR
jgi:4-amino-4-deoxy-L-arabinose transferase-like glycosyltransferase